MKPYYWQTDTAVALNSWCYTENNQYRNASEIICDLVDIVSKNGNLLLNIGPKADGTIPKKDAEILLEIGEWLTANGEAIYGSHVWRKYGEGPTQVVEGQFSDGIKKEFTSKDIRYTCKGMNIYCFVMKCSEDGSYRIPSLGEQDASRKPNFHGIIKEVQLLGFDTECQWSRDEAGLHLQTGNIQSDKPIVFRVEVD